MELNGLRHEIKRLETELETTAEDDKRGNIRYNIRKLKAELSDLESNM